MKHHVNLHLKVMLALQQYQRQLAREASTVTPAAASLRAVTHSQM